MGQKKYKNENNVLTLPTQSHSDSISLYNKETKKNSSLNYSVKFMAGTYDLDEPAALSILDIECSRKNEMILTSTNDMDFRSSLIPGARVHLGDFSKWTKCSLKFVPRYMMIKRRKNLVRKGRKTSLTFEVEPLSMHEMFHSLTMEFSHLHEEKPSSGRRQSIDTKKSFMFFGFNYDHESQSVEKPVIDLYSDNYNRITCQNCYAYIDSGIILKVDTSWLTINDFKVGIYGDTKANFEVDYNFAYHLSKTWKNTIFEKKFPSVKFMIGSIPLYIAPAIQFDTELNLELDAHIKVTSKVSFSEYAEMSINYDGKQIYSDKRVDPIQLEYQLPEIDKGATGGSLNVDFTVYPIMKLFVYAVAPVVVTGEPKLFFAGDVNTERLKYDTYYSVDVELALNPLEVPKDIPEIGGKTYDFGGKLPYGKQWTIIEKTPLQCKYCSGEYKIPKF